MQVHVECRVHAFVGDVLPAARLSGVGALRDELAEVPRSAGVVHHEHGLGRAAAPRRTVRAGLGRMRVWLRELRVHV